MKLSRERYEEIRESNPWTSKSIYEPVSKISLEELIYSSGEYMICRDIRVWGEDGTDTLSEIETKICKAYYETACEMNLSRIGFDTHFIGICYKPTKEDEERLTYVDNTIIAKMREKLNIIHEIESPSELWKSIKKIARG